MKYFLYFYKFITTKDQLLNQALAMLKVSRREFIFLIGNINKYYKNNKKHKCNVCGNISILTKTGKE